MNSTRTSLLRNTAIGGSLLAAVTAATIALWPESDADKARDDGRELGEAVVRLADADSQAEVEAAQDDIRVAVDGAREHAGDFAGEQAAEQAGNLDMAVEGYVGALTTDSDWDAEAYEYELDYALDSLADNAADFREEAPEVRQAFWEGFEDGLEA